MATAPLYSGGARRSAVPMLQAPQLQQSAALNFDPELLRQRLEQEAAADAPLSGIVGGSQLGSTSEALGRGTGTISFGGEAAPGAGQLASRVGAGLSTLGVLSENPALGGLGSVLSLGGGLSRAATSEEALVRIASFGAPMLGAPGYAISGIKSALDGDTAGMVNAALFGINPALGAVNSLLGLATGKTLGSLVGGSSDSKSSISSGYGSNTSSMSNAFGIGDAFGGNLGNDTGGYGYGYGGSLGGASDSDSGDSGSAAGASTGRDSGASDSGGYGGGYGGY